jgi:hypothetical protein
LRLLLALFIDDASTSKTAFIKLYYAGKIRAPWESRYFDEELEEDLQKKEQAERENYEQEAAYHPGRCSNYDISAYPKIQPEEFRTDYLFLEWIRQASNVSPLFRKELGAVLWTNIHLEYQSGCPISEDAWQYLPPMLIERPVIHRSIKSLCIKLEFKNEIPWENVNDFEAWCNYISKTLKLEKFQLGLWIDEEEICQLSMGEGRFSPLLELRKLPVSKEFHIDWAIDTKGAPHRFNQWPENYEAREIYIDGLKAEWEPILRQSILPDTLRVIKESEEEKYLKSRRQLRSSKDIPEE